MAVVITDKPNEIHAVADGFTVTVLKDGAARIFKRNAIRQHDPKTDCPECGTGLERVQARTSTGALAGEFRYCNHCAKPVGPSVEKHVWVVAELDGVRLYAHKGSFILTKQDLNP